MCLRCLFVLALLVVWTSVIEAQQYEGLRNVGEIIVLGNERIATRTILRELELKPGARVGFIEMQNDRRRLENTQLFRHVDVLLQPSDSSVANLLVYVEEKSPWYPFPLTFVTQEDGWSVGAGLEYHGLFGRRMELGIYSVTGAVDYSTIKLSDPFLFGDRVGFNLQLRRLERDNVYEEYHQVQYRGELGLNKEILPDLRAEILAGWRVEQADRMRIARSGGTEDNIPFLRLQFLFDRRDLFSNPSKGWRIGTTVGQIGIIGGDVDHRLLQTMAAVYLPLGWFGRSLALGMEYSGRLGAVGVYDQFYLGGTETVRGLPLNSDRGRQMLLAMAEYRVDLIRSIQLHDDAHLGVGGVLFWDSGTAWNPAEALQEQRFRHSVGAGLRLFVPIVEVIRLDYGWSLDGDSAVQIATLAKF